MEVIKNTLSTKWHKFEQTAYNLSLQTAEKIDRFLEKNAKQVFFYISITTLCLTAPIPLAGSACIAGILQRAKILPAPGSRMTVFPTIFSMIAATMAMILVYSPAGAQASLTSRSVVWLFSTLMCATSIRYRQWS